MSRSTSDTERGVLRHLWSPPGEDDHSRGARSRLGRVCGAGASGRVLDGSAATAVRADVVGEAQGAGGARYL